VTFTLDNALVNRMLRASGVTNVTSAITAFQCVGNVLVIGMESQARFVTKHPATVSAKRTSMVLSALSVKQVHSTWKSATLRDVRDVSVLVSPLAARSPVCVDSRTKI